MVGPVDRIADLRPVHQVAAVEDRDARKPGEGRIDEIIIVADAGDAGVGVEALEDWVANIRLAQAAEDCRRRDTRTIRTAPAFAQER